MPEDIEPAPAPTVTYTVHLVYKSSRKEFLFLIPAQSKDEALAIFHSLGYHLQRRAYEIEVVPALEIHNVPKPPDKPAKANSFAAAR